MLSTRETYLFRFFILKRTMAETGGVIPTIDLVEVSDKILNQKIREASERWGCFRVINHGVSVSLMSDMKKTIMDLFERPHEVKMRNTDVLQGIGYRAPYAINPYYETLGLYDMASPQAVNTFCDQLDASPDQRFLFILLVLKRFMYQLVVVDLDYIVSV